MSIFPLPAGLSPFEDAIRQELLRFESKPNGHREGWRGCLRSLPTVNPSSIHLNSDTVQIGLKSDLTEAQADVLQQCLQAFKPWRKGPFQFFGTHIDTEWRSDWKWNRLKDSIQPLKGRKVLDVGCGSGYHCWRMLGAEAAYVLGIDPSLLYWMQFQMVKKYIPTAPVFYLPFKMEHFPPKTQFFDSVFSMGVLYHRKSPFLHLEELKYALRMGAEHILETLITDGPLHHCFVPSDRYAQMRNVWCIPSIDTLLLWLKKMGFRNERCIHVSTTTVEEQRTTEWMTFHSLKDYLDPKDNSRTIEGYPAPKRAILLANR
ncbi:MAG: tRNA 5-methoxyuridine(34)/uridine 5-oxyacetic acid(34) synthase CmoB [Myxococcota bacterium]|nr:tRNA 5-methoxyuridine(34)/uridine 5-oxyacetic acid(34) synthase CmoB [Myxococcota bacterium]